MRIRSLSCDLINISSIYHLPLMLYFSVVLSGIVWFFNWETRVYLSVPPNFCTDSLTLNTAPAGADARLYME
jgi:hypothetical protein